MLDIHDYNGQLALEAAGLMDEFRGLILEGRQAMRILDPDGTVLFEKADDGTGGRPEVQRGELRQILLDSLPAGTVRWGHKVSGARALGEGRHEVTLRRRHHRRHEPAGRRGRRVVAGPAAALRRRTRVHRQVVRRDLPVRRATPGTRPPRKRSAAGR